MKTILVPLDGSTRAELGLATATRVAWETGAELVLLRAGLYARAAHDRTGPHDEEVTREAAAYLEEIRLRLAREGFSARTMVLPGDAVTAILFAAGSEGAGLICMTTHGHGGLRDRVFGSVTAAVLRASDHPILITRADRPAAGDGRWSLRTILVGLDGTAFAESGLSFLAETGLGRNSTVLLAQAVQGGPTPPTPGLVSERALERLVAEARQITERQLEEAEAYIHIAAGRTLPGWHSRPIVMAGEPGSVLVDVARGEHVDLVVLTTHDRRGVDRLLHGSVAHSVLRHSDAPVLILRGSAVAAQPELATSR